jgi:hypothetical protein
MSFEREAELQAALERFQERSLEARLREAHAHHLFELEPRHPARGLSTLLFAALARLARGVLALFARRRHAAKRPRRGSGRATASVR